MASPASCPSRNDLAMTINRRVFLASSLNALAFPASAAEDPLAGRFGGPFTLTAADGKLVSDTDFRGKFMLVYFGYTHCPDVCPDDLLVMAEAEKLLGADAARVQMLFISVDPERDTPSIMAEYVGSFSPSLIGLSGTETEIAALAKAYRVHRHKFQPPEAAKDPGNYIVDHSSLKYLMGPDGKFRTLVPHGTSAARMVEIMRVYLVKG